MTDDSNNFPPLPRIGDAQIESEAAQKNLSALETEKTSIHGRFIKRNIGPEVKTNKAAKIKIKRKKSWLTRLFLWGISLAITGIVVGIIAVLFLYNYFSKDLPDSSSLNNYKPAGVTRLYSNDGELIAEYAKERRIFVPYSEIPKKVINAFVAAEDQNFYTHQGIDPMGILRALLSNLRKYGTGEKSLVGGSTITQQVVKNFLLSREKSMERKIKEAILALRITQTYSKDRILELYLNEIYLGMSAYGVAAAAKEFFNKELDALSTEEAAVLASMPKAPAYYDPRKRPSVALARRNYVIERMYEDGYINEAEYERALNSKMVVVPTSTSHLPSTYFTEEVRRELLDLFGYDNLYSGSLYVKTTLDMRAQKLLDNSLRYALTQYDRRMGFHGAIAHLNDMNDWQQQLQQIAKKTPIYDEQKLAVVSDFAGVDAIIKVMGESDLQKIPLSEMRWARLIRPSGVTAPTPQKASDSLSKGDVVIVSPIKERAGNWRLEQIPKVNGALVAMRPQTGEIIALSGGYDAHGDQFNRATQAKRQPGSAFKPFVYLTAFERGFTPSSIVSDAPIELVQGAGLPMWRPKNYDNKFLGAVTLRVGVEKSRNVMTVRLSQMVGLKPIIRLAKRLGIYDDVPFNYSTILGAHETTVDKLVAAYGMVANGGLKIKPTLITRVDDNIGRVIYRNKSYECKNCAVQAGVSAIELPNIIDKRERVLDSRVAYQMVNVLRGVVERGTAVSAKVLQMDIGGKTGTTNDSRDAWFVGFSSDIVVGGYIGYDKPKDMGKKETGGRVALPAFINFMREYYGNNKPIAFAKPEGILEVGVDKYTGTPPLPWQQSGGVLREVFVTGSDIFVPEDERKEREAEAEKAAESAAKRQQQMEQNGMEEGIYSPNGSYLPNNLQGEQTSPNTYPYDMMQTGEQPDPPQANPLIQPNLPPSIPQNYRPSAPLAEQYSPEPEVNSPQVAPILPKKLAPEVDGFTDDNLPLNHPSRRYQRNLGYPNGDAGTGGTY
jgi:penicillin-binding protein 1A